MYVDVSPDNFPGRLFGRALDTIKADPFLGTYVKRIENPGRRWDNTSRILNLLPLLPNVKTVRGLIWDNVKMPAKRRKFKLKPHFLSVSVQLTAPTARLGDFFDLSGLNRFGLHVMSPWLDYAPLLREVPRHVHEWEMSSDTLDGLQGLLSSIADRAGVRVLHLVATDAADATPSSRLKTLSPNPLQLFPELRFLRLRCFDPTSVISTAHSKLTYLTLGPLACEYTAPLEPEDRYDSPSEDEGDEEEVPLQAKGKGRSVKAEPIEAGLDDADYDDDVLDPLDGGGYSSNDGDAEDEADSDDAPGPSALSVRRTARAPAWSTPKSTGTDDDSGDDDDSEDDDCKAVPDAEAKPLYLRRAGIPDAWGQHMSAEATGFGPDAPIRVAAWRVARIHRAAPNQFPSLVGVGFIPGQGLLLSFEAWARRRLEGVRPMARALQAANLTLLDQDGEIWQDVWFDEMEPRDGQFMSPVAC